MSTKAIVLAVSCGALAFGCGSDQQQDGSENQEIIDNLVEAGFPVDDIMVVDNVVYLGRDAAVSLQASREMLETNDAAGGEEQFRTNNLVSRSVTSICVIGRAFNGIPSFNTALNMAIDNYNGLGLTFRLRRVGNSNGCAVTITARVSAGTGGSAGFPSGGRPFGEINIGSGLTGFPIDTIEHVITHELGHTVGFRHSDFFNRAISCGGAASNEGNGGVGAILIPGTPSGAVVGQSVMNSCFRQNENGEFTASDRTALQLLY